MSIESVELFEFEVSSLNSHISRAVSYLYRKTMSRKDDEMTPNFKISIIINSFNLNSVHTPSSRHLVIF